MKTCAIPALAPSNNYLNKVMSTTQNFDDGHNSTSTSDLMNQEDNIKIKQKELRQLEQKLNRYEEQLKLKEAMINDDSKEKKQDPR